MRTVGPLSSRIVARARPLVSYARTPVPTVPKGSRRPSSAHRFFAGFKDEGDSGGDLFLGTTTAPARCAGVEGPSVFVRRYRVPQALHSMGLDAGPRRHCGESARWVPGNAGGRGGDIVSERSGDGRQARRCADRRRRGGAREVASAPARAFPRVSGAGNATDALSVPQMKKAKGERRGTYRQRRSGRTVPPA